MTPTIVHTELTVVFVYVLDACQQQQIGLLVLHIHLLSSKHQIFDPEEMILELCSHFSHFGVHSKRLSKILFFMAHVTMLRLLVADVAHFSMWGGGVIPQDTPRFTEG